MLCACMCMGRSVAQEDAKGERIHRWELVVLRDALNSAFANSIATDLATSQLISPSNLSSSFRGGIEDDLGGR